MGDAQRRKGNGNPEGRRGRDCLVPPTQNQPGEQRQRARGERAAGRGALAHKAQEKVTSSEALPDPVRSLLPQCLCLSKARLTIRNAFLAPGPTMPSPSGGDRRPITRHPAWRPPLSRSLPVSWHLLSACSVLRSGLRKLRALTSQHSQGSLSRWYYSLFFPFCSSVNKNSVEGPCSGDGLLLAEPGLKCRRGSRAQAWDRSALPSASPKRWFNGKDRKLLFRPEMTRVNR